MAVTINEVYKLAEACRAFGETAAPNEIQVQAMQDRCRALAEALEESAEIKNRLNKIYKLTEKAVLVDRGSSSEWVPPLTYAKSVLFAPIIKKRPKR